MASGPTSSPECYVWPLIPLARIFHFYLGKVTRNGSRWREGNKRPFWLSRLSRSVRLFPNMMCARALLVGRRSRRERDISPFRRFSIATSLNRPTHPQTTYEPLSPSFHQKLRPPTAAEDSISPFASRALTDPLIRLICLALDFLLSLVG